MRHRYQKKKLGRTQDQRQALFKNLIRSLIAHEKIETTESKAKVIKRLFDKLVTKGKEGTLHKRRLVHAFLQDKKIVNKLFDQVAPLFKDIKGGFTRMVRLGKRRGDDAMIVRLELTRLTEKETSEKRKKNGKAQAKETKTKSQKGKKEKEKSD